MDDWITTSKAWDGVVKKGSISTNIYNQNLSDRYIVTRLMRMLLMMIGIADTTWYNHLAAVGIDNRNTVTSCGWWPGWSSGCCWRLLLERDGVLEWIRVVVTCHLRYIDGSPLARVNDWDRSCPRRLAKWWRALMVCVCSGRWRWWRRPRRCSKPYPFTMFCYLW